MPTQRPVAQSLLTTLGSTSLHSAPTLVFAQSLATPEDATPPAKKVKKKLDKSKPPPSPCNLNLVDGSKLH
jgi:hypothetical protein